MGRLKKQESCSWKSSIEPDPASLVEDLDDIKEAKQLLEDL